MNSPLSSTLPRNGFSNKRTSLGGTQTLSLQSPNAHMIHLQQNDGSPKSKFARASHGISHAETGSIQDRTINADLDMS